MRFSGSICLILSSLASLGLAVVSTDGSCGGARKYTCVGSRYGNCCSSQGNCGASVSFCGSGCQVAYGNCGSNVAPAAQSSSKSSSIRSSSSSIRSSSSSIRSSSTSTRPSSTSTRPSSSSTLRSSSTPIVSSSSIRSSSSSIVSSSQTSSAPACTSTDFNYVDAFSNNNCVPPAGYINTATTGPNTDQITCAQTMRATPQYQFYVLKLYNFMTSSMTQVCYFYTSVAAAPNANTCVKDNSIGYSEGIKRDCA